MDFNVDKRTDVTFGTVAASRVRSREDVLILRRRTIEREREGRAWVGGLSLAGRSSAGSTRAARRRAQRSCCSSCEARRWTGKTKAPSATCEKCKERKTLDYFSDRQWERVRANRSAICLACGPSKGGQKTLKRKLPSGLARLDCRGCKSRKLEDAFPRAQLQQDESEAKRRCLKCLKGVPLREKRKATAEVGPRRLVRLPNLRNFPASARRGEGRGQCSAPAVLELRRPRLPGEGLPLLSQMREAVDREASRGREPPTALPKVQGQVIAGRSAGKNGGVRAPVGLELVGFAFRALRFRF